MVNLEGFPLVFPESAGAEGHATCALALQSGIAPTG